MTVECDRLAWGNTKWCIDCRLSGRDVEPVERPEIVALKKWNALAAKQQRVGSAWWWR